MNLPNGFLPDSQAIEAIFWALVIYIVGIAFCYFVTGGLPKANNKKDAAND